MDTVSNEQLLPANPRKYARPSESNVGSIRMLAVWITRYCGWSFCPSRRASATCASSAKPLMITRRSLAQYVVFRSNVVLLNLTCPR